MNRKTCSDFIVNHIHLVCLNDKYTIARILMFRECALKQNNNGAYILFDHIDGRTLRDIYEFINPDFELMHYTLIPRGFLWDI